MYMPAAFNLGSVRTAALAWPNPSMSGRSTGFAIARRSVSVGGRLLSGCPGRGGGGRLWLDSRPPLVAPFVTGMRAIKLRAVRWFASPASIQKDHPTFMRAIREGRFDATFEDRVRAPKPPSA